MEYQIINHQHIFMPRSAGFAECHASTVCLLPDGCAAAAWFGGDREKAPNVGIWFSRQKKKDGSFTSPVRVAEGKEMPAGAGQGTDLTGMHSGEKKPYRSVPCWNPVLYADKTRVLLFYKVGEEIPDWRTFVIESSDFGEHWSSERELVPGDFGGRGPVKNKCIRLRDGAILAPASREGEYWDCFTDRSEDNGRTWNRSGNVPLDHGKLKGKGIIQPSLWEDGQRLVHMLARSTEGFLYQSISSDGGRSWSPAERTGLPNNNSGIDLTRLEDERLVLVYNPVSGNWAARSPIAFSVSDDNGITWGEPQILDHVPCDRNVKEAEFSYPAAVSRGSEVYITYTWKRSTIAFWHIRILP